MALVMPRGFNVISLVLEDPLVTRLGDVEDLQRCPPKDGCVVIEISLVVGDIGRGLLPPFVCKVDRVCLVPPGLQLGHRLAQGLQPKIVLKDLVNIHAEEEVHLVLDMGSDVIADGLHAHHANILPPFLGLDLEDFEGAQGTQLDQRHLGDVVHHDVEDDSVAHHEVLVGRCQEFLQVMLNVPETKHRRLVSVWNLGKETRGRDYSTSSPQFDSRGQMRAPHPSHTQVAFHLQGPQLGLLFRPVAQL